MEDLELVSEIKHGRYNGALEIAQRRRSNGCNSLLGTGMLIAHAAMDVEW